MSLKALVSALDAYPDVVSTDLQAAGEFIDALTYVFGTIRHDVFIHTAVLKLENSLGYPVGHIVFDCEPDLYKFVPYSDEQDKEEN